MEGCLQAQWELCMPSASRLQAPPTVQIDSELVLHDRCHTRIYPAARIAAPAPFTPGRAAARSTAGSRQYERASCVGEAAALDRHAQACAHAHSMLHRTLAGEEVTSHLAAPGTLDGGSTAAAAPAWSPSAAACCLRRSCCCWSCATDGVTCVVMSRASRRVRACAAASITRARRGWLARRAHARMQGAQKAPLPGRP